MVDRTKNPQPVARPKKQSVEPAENLTAILSQKVVGQPAATRVIVPYIQMFQAGLAPEGRPVGVFLLLGPTGTGKTKTVEALAEVLHGSEKNLLKVDCGEFQMEHEVAKLIGAPPGYLGHRETQPMLTQQKLNAVTSDRCGLSLVLFDEIEKAAPSLTRLLLGVLDKGVLRLGDNSTVNFEKSLVFLTSNLGAREMMKEINPDFGFGAGAGMERADLTSKLQNIALVAVRKKFSPGVRQPHSPSRPPTTNPAKETTETMNPCRNPAMANPTTTRTSRRSSQVTDRSRRPRAAAGRAAGRAGRCARGPRSPRSTGSGPAAHR